MKLNCDLGEDKPLVDASVMPYIDYANIACGGHVSDTQGMHDTVKLALKHNVTIGAHPSYEDKANFGRVDQELSSNEISALIVKQTKALHDVCLIEGASISYVKPHGALYNRMMRDVEVFKAVVAGMKQLQSSLSQTIPLMVLAQAGDNSAFDVIAADAQIPLIKEVFCDRGYLNDGSLVPRSEHGAILSSAEINERINELLKEGTLQTVSGKSLEITADTICVHGDDANALESVKSIRSIIDKAAN